MERVGVCISPPSIVDHYEDERQVTAKTKEIGEYVNIPYKKAVELTACTLVGNRSGIYYFIKNVSEFLLSNLAFNRVASQPVTCRFSYNKSMKKLRFYSGGTLVSVINTVN